MVSSFGTVEDIASLLFRMSLPERIYIPIKAMGFSECLPFSRTTLRGKHCWCGHSTNHLEDLVARCGGGAGMARTATYK